MTAPFERRPAAQPRPLVLARADDRGSGKSGYRNGIQFRGEIQPGLRSGMRTAISLRRNTNACPNCLRLTRSSNDGGGGTNGSRLERKKAQPIETQS